jgi:Cu2+-exporting ATPase
MIAAPGRQSDAVRLADGSPADPAPAAATASRSHGGDRSHCGHCGQLVIGCKTPDAHGEIFCCEGCRNIHGWLRQARMDGYYDLMEQSGKKAPQAYIGEDYRAFLASLDGPEALAGLGRRSQGRHALSLTSGEIACAGCGWLLERLLQGAPGVRIFDVDFLHGEAFLEYDPALTTLKDILSVPAGFGYRLRPKTDAAPAKHVPDKTLLYRLAVSGACFANAMAFSLAVYLGAFKGMPRAWVEGFGTLGVLLSIPAVAYSAFPFFAGAWGALKGGRFNIDVTVSIGIVLSFALTVSSLAAGGAGNFSDSLTGLIFFLLLGRWTVRRFEAGLALKGRWFEALRPGLVRVRRQSAREGVERVAADQIQDGDIVELLGGEYAPVDGSLASEEAWMDTSLLTGESRAARFQRGDSVFAGYLNVRGRAALIARGNAGNTRIARLGRDLDALAAGRRSVPDGVGRVAKWFTLAVLACGFATLLLRWREGAVPALGAAASVFIISCACALALAAPISRGLGLKRAMGLGFHFRSQTSLEALRGIRCILFDKTGTLTFMRRTVSQWKWTEGKREAEAAEPEILKAIRSLCRRSLHPVALSLFRALEALPAGGWDLIESEERAHFGLVGRFAAPGGEGPRREICVCRYGAWEGAEGEFARLGYPSPILPGAAADTCVFLDGRLVALVRFTDEIRPDVANLAADLRSLGVTAVLLSGDNREKVGAFAAACGFEHAHAGLTPEEKSRLGAGYRKRFGPTLAVGDGFNDNLLFGAADLAMAIQGGAVDLSKGTDILFTGASPAELPRLFALAGRVKRSIALSFWVSGAYNLFAIQAAMSGGVSPLFAALLMPLSSLSLCAVALAIIRAPAPRRPRAAV